MKDSKFSCIDLSHYFNATNEPDGWHPAIGQDLKSFPLGEQNFWGIPFQLGSANTNCYMLFERSEDVTTIELPHTNAAYIVFAHFCNESHDPSGQEHSPDYEVGFITKPGEQLADYVLVYADGSEHRQPIRRRFEISEAKITWGQLAFAARPHIEQLPLDWRGPHPSSGWGRQQTSVDALPLWDKLLYWIYALENPKPEAELQLIRIEPTGVDRMAIVGVTLYHGHTHPLQHRRLETFRATLPDPIGQDVLNSSIDLGTIARTYSVPDFEPELWLNEMPIGWGEESQDQRETHELMMDVTANPESTLQVRDHSIEMKEVYENGVGQSTDGHVKIEIVTPNKTWLQVKVIDESTGKPTPVRVHFRASDGRYFPPYGHRHEVNANWFEDYGADLKLGSTQYAYVDGRFQIELPTEDVYVEIVKGMEYRPIRKHIVIQPGQRDLSLNIERAFDWRSKGWVTADTHVHFVSPQTAWLEAQAEGVNLVNLLASQWGDLFTNVGDLTGEQSAASRDDTIIWVGTENRQHLLGHMSLLGVKGEPVYPMCAGGPSESYLGDPAWMTLAQWSDLCREREGLVVIPHFPNPYAEVAADIVLGKVDAVEIRHFTAALDGYNIREWYRFLNCGYRVAAVGGTDKMSAGMPIGGVRTYAHLGDREFSFANWADAVRAGRTFTTSGPLIWMQVEGHQPGDDIVLPETGGTVGIEVWAQSIQPFHELQVIVNGQIALSETYKEGVQEARIQDNLYLEGSAWIAARCISALKVWHEWPIHVAAHTSPVYVRCGDVELFNPSDATFMLTLIEGGLTWLDTLSIPASKEQQARNRKVFEDAQKHLTERLAKVHHGHPHKDLK